MIYWVRTVTIRNTAGNELKREMMSWHKKLVKLNNKKWPGVDAELLTNFDGSRGELHFKQKFDSIAASQEFAENWWNDEEAKSLINELHDIEKRFGQSTITEDVQDHYYNIVDPD